jgi:drug/metabolite transporter (DMT)-like permease
VADTTVVKEAGPLPGATALGTAGLSVGFVVMWSSGFIGGRLGTESASTLGLMSWRFLLLVPLVAVVFALAARRGRGPTPAHWGREAVVGTLSQVVSLGGVVGAIEYGVSAGTSAIVAALQPLLAGALAGPMLGQKVGIRQWIGLAVGFTGVVVVVGGDLTAGSAPAWAYLLPFAGMVALVAATLIEARTPSRLPLPEGLGVQCLVSAIVFTAFAAVAGELAGPHLGQPSFWAAVAWVVALSTLGGYGFYWATLRRTDATRVSALLYLTPPTTAIWAWLMFGDTMTWVGLLGFAICAVGVIVVFLRRRTDPRGRGARARPAAPRGRGREAVVSSR